MAKQLDREHPCLKNSLLLSYDYSLRASDRERLTELHRLSQNRTVIAQVQRVQGVKNHRARLLSQPRSCDQYKCKNDLSRCHLFNSAKRLILSCNPSRSSAYIYSAMFPCKQTGSIL